MELRNCEKCGQLFTYDGIHKVCPNCREEEEDNFKKVKDYLWEHPNSSIEKVSEETGVEKDIIIKFVKEDRLASEGLDIKAEVKCERCGASISQGTLCNRCRKELIDGLSPKAKDKSKKKKKSKKDDMFLKDRVKKRKKRNN